MRPVFMVARRVQHETSEGRCDVAVHFERVDGTPRHIDQPKKDRESDFALVFTTKESHLAAQFPLGGRFLLVPEWEQKR